MYSTVCSSVIERYTVRMVLLRFSSSLFIVALCGIAHINGQFEEYYRWKQITFAPLDNGKQNCWFLIHFGKPFFWRSNQLFQNNFIGSDGAIFPQTNKHQSQSNSENNLPMGATRYKDRIFVTLPRFVWKSIANCVLRKQLFKMLLFEMWRRRPGIPSTLNVISAKASKGSGPSYKPFPNAETNKLHVNSHFWKKLFNWI